MFKVDVGNVGTNIKQFPNGVYYAVIEEPEFKLSKKNNLMLAFKLRIYHQDYGEAVIYDNLPVNAPFKVKPFWLAFNNWTEEEFLANGTAVEIDDPSIIDGAEILVQIGDQEDKATQKVYKSVVSPYYFPVSRKDDLLNW